MYNTGIVVMKIRTFDEMRMTAKASRCIRKINTIRHFVIHVDGLCVLPLIP